MSLTFFINLLILALLLLFIIFLFSCYDAIPLVEVTTTNETTSEASPCLVNTEAWNRRYGANLLIFRYLPFFIIWYKGTKYILYPPNISCTFFEKVYSQIDRVRMMITTTKTTKTTEIVVKVVRVVVKKSRERELLYKLSQLSFIYRFSSAGGADARTCVPTGSTHLATNRFTFKRPFYCFTFLLFYLLKIPKCHLYERKHGIYGC